MTYWHLAKNTISSDRMVELFTQVAESGNYTCGNTVEVFEHMLADYLDTKYCVMVNSGSSANLLMIATLVESGRLKQGDKVLVPAVSWSTTYFPLAQYGLIPVFIDVDKDGILDLFHEIIKIHPEIKAILAVNLLGKTIDIQLFYDFCIDNGLLLLEDNCESFGSFYSGLNKKAGSLASMATNSFFFSHQLNAIEGGCITTNEEAVYYMLKSLRAHGWTREQDANSPHWHPSGDNFKDSFTFINKGYCLRPQEINASVGIESLKNITNEAIIRNKNAKYFYQVVSDIPYVSTLDWIKDSRYNTFGLPMFFKCPEDRSIVYRALLDVDIHTRPIIGGNFLNQPVMRKIPHETCGTFKNAEWYDKCGMMFGNYGEDLTDQIDEMSKVLRDLL